MQSDKAKDIALGVFVLCIAAVGFLCVNPADAPITTGPGGLSWRTIPYIYSGLLLALGALYIVITVVRGEVPVDEAAEEEALAEAGAISGEEAPPPEPLVFGFPRSDVRRVAVVGVLVVYSQSLEAFGFAISTPVFLYATLYIFGRKDVRENLSISILGGLLLWVLFDYFLKMPVRGAVWDPLSPALDVLIQAVGG